MPEYLYPGVYIEEIERGPRPIEGVPTSTAAFVGETERGPQRPTPVTSFKEYQRIFGGFFGRDRYMPYAVNGFFENGGKRMFVARVVAVDGQRGVRGRFGDFDVKAVGPGAWGKNVWVKIGQSSTKVADPTDPKKPGVPIGFRLQLAYWSTPPTNAVRPVRSEQARRNAATAVPGGLRRPFDRSDLARLLREASRRCLDRASVACACHHRPQQGRHGRAGRRSGCLSRQGRRRRRRFRARTSVRQDASQGLTALELDPYRDVALVHAPYPATRTISPRKSPGTSSTIARTCDFALASWIGIRKLPPGTLDPRRDIPKDSSYGAVYAPWIHISDPVTGGAANRAAGRPCARRVRAHRRGARCLQGARQRDSSAVRSTCTTTSTTRRRRR